MIHESVVAGGVMRGLTGELRMREKAEDAETVIDGNEEDAVIEQRAVVVERAGTGASLVGAAVYPEHYGQRFRGGPYGRDDVKKEAVFAAVRVVVAVPGATEKSLRAGRAKSAGVADAGPSLVGHWRVPAQRTDRWLRVRNAEKLRAAFGAGDAANEAGSGRDYERVVW